MENSFSRTLTMNPHQNYSSALIQKQKSLVITDSMGRFLKDGVIAVFVMF